MKLRVSLFSEKSNSCTSFTSQQTPPPYTTVITSFFPSQILSRSTSNSPKHTHTHTPRVSVSASASASTSSRSNHTHMLHIMPNITHDNRNPKLLFHNALILRGLSCSYQYHKLPKTRLKLSVLKLDGSSFGVEVPMSATVAELKLALEEFFNVLSKDERCVISWSHVWGHFCLCYEGEKLLDDKAYIKRLGIKDGDQIKFVRHVTINYRAGRQQIKNQSDEPKHCSMSRDHKDGESDDANNCDSVKVQETSIYECQCEEDESAFMPSSKLTNFLRGWFSYRKFRNVMV